VLGGLLPQAYFTSNLSSPRLIALVADLVVLTGLAVAVVLRGMPRLVGAVLAAMVGLTFGTALALREVRWPWVLTWLGLISYSVYLLHPTLIQVYRHLPWTAHHYSVWPQLLVDASFLVILIALCSLTYLFVERPMQNVGRWLARWLDAQFGPDRAPGRAPAAEPALARRPQAAAE
jgi:peptidoglycan/LPS O-acetylase OafA/YrhL